jgi:glycosyltransferase involved in cell wall biosynthesis
MKRIIFVIPSLGAGGTERQLTHLIKGLEKKYNITVLCTRNGGAFAGDVRRHGRVDVLGLRGGWDPRLRSRLEKLFRKYKPDIVHSFMFGFDYVVNVAARRSRVPIVISSRRQLADWKKPRHIRLQKKANPLVDAIVANSCAVAAYSSAQEEWPIDGYHVIYNGIDATTMQSVVDPEILRKRFRIPEGKKVIGMVANMSPVKDYPLFLEAAVEILAKRTDVHFLMVGHGPGVHSIEKKIKKMNAQNSITHIKTVSEMPDLFRVFSVSVLTSKVEGLPNVVMEAMAAKVPIVASSVGGIPELIENERSGLLVHTRTPKSFADAIERCLNEPDQTQQRVDDAYKRIVQEFSLPNMVESYDDLYCTLSKKAQQESD